VIALHPARAPRRPPRLRRHPARLSSRARSTLDRLAAELAASDPRLDVDADELIDLADATIRDRPRAIS
jgi:hypothetical protein